MAKLQEIIYRPQGHTGPLNPIEVSRETVNPECWFQQEGRTFLTHAPGKEPGSGPCDITDLLTGDHPKFALIKQ